jgi:hypothetical protein
MNEQLGLPSSAKKQFSDKIGSKLNVDAITAKAKYQPH